jgi:hypothetical protein
MMKSFQGARERERERGGIRVRFSQPCVGAFACAGPRPLHSPLALSAYTQGLPVSAPNLGACQSSGGREREVWQFLDNGRERARESGMPRRLARQWLLTSPLAAASRSIFPALYEPALVDPDGKLLAAFPPPRIRSKSGASTLEHGASLLRMNTHQPAFATSASCNAIDRGCEPRGEPEPEASA